jgi:tRNA threonylcarbamoyladenosine biosynthesis protein TsaE
MNSFLSWNSPSTSAVQTEQFAAKIGSKLRGGEVVELVSDLGGGKTTFTRGLVRGTGSLDRVGSPTFTLSREYTAPKFKIIHFDFYRLDEGGIVADELAEFIGDPAYVIVVEWGDVVQDVLPESRLNVKFEQTGDEERTIIASYPSELGYLLEGLK